MHDNDKTCFVFRTACLCPNSCATNDDRQMWMTDKDTPHGIEDKDGPDIRKHNDTRIVDELGEGPAMGTLHNIREELTTGSNSYNTLNSRGSKRNSHAPLFNVEIHEEHG